METTHSQKEIDDGGAARHPLVAADGLFLLGLVLATQWSAPAGVVLASAAMAWIGWLVSEKKGGGTAATICLCTAITLSGAEVWLLNQDYGERMNVARLAPADGTEAPVTLRVEVLATDQRADSIGSRRWMGRVREILVADAASGAAAERWLPAAGDVLVRWNGAGGKTQNARTELAGGERVEVYGWLSRPQGAENPGGPDLRQQLAAERIFAMVRVPRATGIVALGGTRQGPGAWLESARIFLRGKLLEHTLTEDAPAGYTLTALLLGHRDPAIDDVSQSFADAGVAHLLAISGMHIMLFAGAAWAILRLVPVRPRWRELIMAAMVGVYVLATPCGPPIERAAVALVMLVAARIAGRPREYLNMLALAAIVVVLLRPTDIASAGFQLSFLATAALIVMSRRVHEAIFGCWLARETLAADLADTPTARRRLGLYRAACGILTANLIGATSAAPLVAFHFGQVNLWAVLAGFVALPVVCVAMIAGAMQLLAELAWSGLGALFSPVTSAAGRAMIWVVAHLALLPGSALPVRAPPIGAVAGMYGVLGLWMLRRQLGISRAVVVNAALAVAVLTAGWYAWSMPVGHLRIDALSVGSNGQAGAAVVRTPGGGIWLMNASPVRGGTITSLATPPLRLAGTRQIAGLLVTSLDSAHASATGEAIRAYRPRIALVSWADWEHRGETLGGAGMERAASAQGMAVMPLQAGHRVAIDGAEVEVLWPPAGAGGGDWPARRDLILRWNYAGRGIVVLDPAAAGALELALVARPEMRCDAVMLLGPKRGEADAGLRRILAALQPRWIIWNGRGAWVGKAPFFPDAKAGGETEEWNTADGAVTIDIDPRGTMRVGR